MTPVNNNSFYNGNNSGIKYPSVEKFQDLSRDSQLNHIKLLNCDLQNHNLTQLFEHIKKEFNCALQNHNLTQLLNKLEETLQCDNCSSTSSEKMNEFLQLRDKMDIPEGLFPQDSSKRLVYIFSRICNKTFFSYKVIAYNLNKLNGGEQTPYYLAEHTVSAVEKLLNQPIKTGSNRGFMVETMNKSFLVEYSLLFLHNFLWAYLESLYPSGELVFEDQANITNAFLLERYSELKAFENIQHRVNICLEKDEQMVKACDVYLSKSLGENLDTITDAREATLSSSFEKLFLSPVNEYIEARIRIDLYKQIMLGTLNLFDNPFGQDQDQRKAMMAMPPLCFIRTQEEKNALYTQVEKLLQALEWQSYHQPKQIVKQIVTRGI